MKEIYRCTIHDIEWTIDTGDKDLIGMCPICAFYNINELKTEIKEYKSLLDSYRKVFKDIGIKNIKIN